MSMNQPKKLPKSATTLPEEIVLYNILPLLPSKSLHRFRCVCKSWNTFTRHPSFLHLRNQTHKHHHLLFLSSHQNSSQPHVFSTPFIAPQPNTTPPRATLLFSLPNLNFSETRVQCVNGLLCFYPRSNTWFSSHVSAFTLIANPTTRQVVTLPLDHSVGGREFLVSTHFGYDPVRDEFKVLRSIRYHASHEFKVFTVGIDGSWRVVVMNCFLSCHKRGICVNGAIHWTYSSGVYEISSLRIVAFDVRSEQFRLMHPPSGYIYRENVAQYLRFPDLVEIGGCLCMVGYSSGSVLKLWILKDYEGGVWERRNVVLSSGVVSQPPQIVFPLCSVPISGEILLVPYFIPRRLRGIYYDSEKISFKSFVIVEMPLPLWPDNRSGDVDIFFCHESFRLLK